MLRCGCSRAPADGRLGRSDSLQVQHPWHRQSAPRLREPSRGQPARLQTLHQQPAPHPQQQQQQQQQQQETWGFSNGGGGGRSSSGSSRGAWLSAAAAAAAAAAALQLAAAAAAAELVESNISELSKGSIPSELSAAGESTGPKLSSLLQGSKKREVEGCTRRCVATCTRGGDGAPGLGPISARREIVVFKSGFRSRAYCLSECAQVCALKVNGGVGQEQQQQPQEQQQQQQQQQQEQRVELASGLDGAP